MVIGLKQLEQLRDLLIIFLLYIEREISGTIVIVLDMPSQN